MGKDEEIRLHNRYAPAGCICGREHEVKDLLATTTTMTAAAAGTTEVFQIKYMISFLPRRAP